MSTPSKPPSVPPAPPQESAPSVPKRPSSIPPGKLTRREREVLIKTVEAAIAEERSDYDGREQELKELLTRLADLQSQRTTDLPSPSKTDESPA